MALPLLDAYQRVLQQELRPPLYLSEEEVRGGWRQLFPELARTLPRPYPIYTPDEEDVLAHGYPVLLTSGIEQIGREIDRQVSLELGFRLTAVKAKPVDKRKVMEQRERYLKAMTALLENALVNDYGRGLAEVLLLFHSLDVARKLADVPKQLTREDSAIGRTYGERFRYEIAGVFGALLRRAMVNVLDRLKDMADSSITLAAPPLLNTICQDLLILAETKVPDDLRQIREYLRLRFKADVTDIETARADALSRLKGLIAEQPEIAAAVRLVAGSNVDLSRPSAMLEPRVLEAIREVNLAARLGLEEDRLELFRDLGRRLKCFELITAMRSAVFRIAPRGPVMVLAERNPPLQIASSARPLDFTRPGVIDSAVRRFGLVYDLSNFTAILEGVRQKGPKAEEQALQFMYIFQCRLDEICRRRRLTFEKFLGDGAFYSSRRAHRIIAAACEIQTLYQELRRGGFPFDQGLRIAINFSTYRLLPMMSHGRSDQRFEFFGRGIVELARLTTGKSTREIEEISEFLVHAGYDPSQVDSFLEPLVEARRGHTEEIVRPFAANIDERGELVNEGIVVTLPFLEQLQAQMGDTPRVLVETYGLRWVVLPLDPDRLDSQYVGLRYMGVARLKGLAPLELVEAHVWPNQPEKSEEARAHVPLIDLMRQQMQRQEPEAVDEPMELIPDNLVLASFFEDDAKRRWVFGEYRDHDRVLLHAIRVPIRIAGRREGEPLENWIFRNRAELAQLYESLRQDTSGQSLPLDTLKRQRGYLACFLCAPHRSPE